MSMRSNERAGRVVTAAATRQPPPVTAATTTEPRRLVAAAGATLLVVLTLAGCGRVADRLDHGETSTTATTISGASPAATSPTSSAPREDGPTPASTSTGPAAADVAELQQALDEADRLADEVDQDIAADGS